MQINFGSCGYGLMKCECLNNRNEKVRIVGPRLRMEYYSYRKQWQWIYEDRSYLQAGNWMWLRRVWVWQE